jgi:ABC-type transporter Mla subunit MlaD
MRRGHKRGVSPFASGAILIAVIAIFTFLVFGNDIPFTKPYELKVVVENAQSIQARSPVRIAGVEVGKVQKIDRIGEEDTSVITVAIEEPGLPIMEDAQVKIRPRIFLEGNFFVDIQPGTPGAKKLESGDTIPMSQTSVPVQLDEVLTTLQADTRKDLQKLIRGYGDALYGNPDPGEDADQDPDVRGKTAAAALNASLEDAPDALRGIAMVNEGMLGQDMHDLSSLIAGTQKVTAALSSNEENLKDLVTNFNRTVAAFADRQGELKSTIAQLPGVLELANSTFDNLNSAFPPTRAFAREILPGVRETPETIDAAFPWVRQTRELVAPDELGGLVNDLQPAMSDLASVVDDSIVLLPQVDLVNRCMLEVVLPTGDLPVDDGFLSTGLPNYKEFWQTMTALSGEGQNFDGNGMYVRFQTGGGSKTFSTGPTGVSEFVGDPLFGNPAIQPQGTRPARPARKPPYNREFECHRNPIPDLSAPTGPGF